VREIFIDKASTQIDSRLKVGAAKKFGHPGKSVRLSVLTRNSLDQSGKALDIER